MRKLRFEIPNYCKKVSRMCGANDVPRSRETDRYHQVVVGWIRHHPFSRNSYPKNSTKTCISFTEPNIYIYTVESSDAIDVPLLPLTPGHDQGVFDWKLFYYPFSSIKNSKIEEEIETELCNISLNTKLTHRFHEYGGFGKRLKETNYSLAVAFCVWFKFLAL